MSGLIVRCIDALASLAGRRARSPWLAECLDEIERHQHRLARAARCVVSGRGPDSLEDLLCSADRVQDRLAELCERTAVIATLRALAAQQERCRDPGRAA